MTYATKFTFDCVWRSFEEMQKKIAAGDYSMLPEVSLFKSSDMNVEGDFCMFNEFLLNGGVSCHACILTHCVPGKFNADYCKN